MKGEIAISLQFAKEGIDAVIAKKKGKIKYIAAVTIAISVN